MGFNHRLSLSGPYRAAHSRGELLPHFLVCRTSFEELHTTSRGLRCSWGRSSCRRRERRPCRSSRSVHRRQRTTRRPATPGPARSLHRRRPTSTMCRPALVPPANTHGAGILRHRRESLRMRGQDPCTLLRRQSTGSLGICLLSFPHHHCSCVLTAGERRR